MAVQLITPPTDEPVTLPEAKAQLRLEHALDDDQVTALILGARQYVEQYCWRGLVIQTWELVEPHFPSDCCGCGLPYFPAYRWPYDAPTARRVRQDQEGVELPKGNLVAVASVKYIDTAGVQQTLVADTDYVVDAVNVPGRVRLAYGKSWPSHREQWDAVRIRYSVGWAIGSVPQPIKSAMLLLISQMYENRTVDLDVAPTTVRALLGPYDLSRHK